MCIYTFYYIYHILLYKLNTKCILILLPVATSQHFLQNLSIIKLQKYLVFIPLSNRLNWPMFQRQIRFVYIFCVN